MQITKEWVAEKGACHEGLRWFIEHFPEGGEYQDVLNALAAENQVNWAQWLLQKAGPANTVLEVDEITAEASLFFAGRVLVKGAIKIAQWILVGSGIEAGWASRLARASRLAGASRLARASRLAKISEFTQGSG